MVVTADLVPDDAEASEDNVFAVLLCHSFHVARGTELGLGFVWRTRGVGLVRDDRMHHFIGSPENQKVVGTIFIGYPEEEREVPVTKRTPYTEKTIWL